MIAQTPPMGWNSWDCYGAAVDEPTVRQNAAYMAEHLKEFGWEYVVVDIQWYQPTATRRPDSRTRSEIRHPHHARDAADGGASALADSGVREGLPRGRESKQHLRVESGYVRLAVRHARSARVL